MNVEQIRAIASHLGSVTDAEHLSEIIERHGHEEVLRSMGGLSRCGWAHNALRDHEGPDCGCNPLWFFPAPIPEAAS